MTRRAKLDLSAPLRKVISTFPMAVGRRSVVLRLACGHAQAIHSSQVPKEAHCQNCLMIEKRLLPDPCLGPGSKR